MNLKLRNKLILSYVLLAIIIIGIISLLINFSVRKNFENYIIDEHEQRVSDIRNNIRHSYVQNNGFDINDIEHIGIKAIEKGLIITVNNADLSPLWSAMEHNAGLCEAMIANVKKNMFNHYSRWEGNYTEDTFDIIVDNAIVGTINVGYLGPFYFNEEELYFLTSINRVLFYVGFFSMFLAILIGIIIANGVTKPIETVIHHLNNMHDTTISEAPNNFIKTLELKALYDSAQTLQKRIGEQEKLRKQLTQDMAHELKTPLTSIQGQMEAMIDGIFPMNTERIGSCFEEIIRIKTLISEIESLSLLENSYTELNLDDFDFFKLISIVAQNFETELIEHQMTMNITLGDQYNPKSYEHFYGDADKIKQVFINLLSNSIKYAGDGTQISIILNNYNHGDYLIQFKDNGRGIQEKDAPFIFERFYRADPSRSGNNGIGIGLTLTQSIIQKHMGKIELVNTEGVGTEFNITFPRTLSQKQNTNRT
ncbi:sensor histidine kinase [Petrocella sp. FN5]|uniref:sensor histidine kinase n=1 Tax=Petrocella sp. FN5 TaxID=3032002 RepID=UPI0023DC7E56|nr:HAMP domain-containing sensor histidine kinase [Petrocella sp. FN5]MDF1616924.1 HAMP domain-containing sensor histidine kinase [Petrocella sp. FN5]